MKVTPTELPEVLILEPRVFQDPRGFFLESYNRKTLAEAAGITAEFVQDNHSRSTRGVLRGLHYQVRQPQDKLVRVLSGRVYDVAVDLRRHSPRFGRWIGVELSGENFRQLWVPKGFGHGFLVLSESAEVMYKTSDYYAPAHERCVRWDDPALGIAWPQLDVAPNLSAKDAQGLPLAQAEVFDA